MDLIDKLDSYTEGQSEKEILASLTSCQSSGLLDEFSINILGYAYLLEREKPEIAECIFRANTLLFPHSPNVYDSYAEALMTNGDLESSVVNYQKAVDVATENGDRDLEFYQANLARAVENLEKGK